MKHIISIFALTLFSSSLIAQTLKTYNGDMQDAILDKGKASYTYYEKGTEIVKHGKFSYSWKDVQAIQVRDKKINVSLIKTISGNYKDGLKDGVWNYAVRFTDYALNHAYSGDYSIPSDNTYSTGSISMQSSYKSGVPNGNWSYTETFKTRYAIPKPYNTWVWSGYSKSNTITLKAQFNDGVLVGNFVYNNPYANESASFNIDNKGFLIGSGKYENLGKTTTLTFQDNMLVREEQSGGSEIEIKTNFVEQLKDPNFDYVKDSVDITDYLDSKLDLFRSNRYFNYRSIISRREELIGGDYFKDVTIKGGAYYKIDKCRAFKESEACGCVKYKNGNWNCHDSKYPNHYQEAFNNFNNGKYEASLEHFKKVKSYLGENSFVCKEERTKYLAETDKNIIKLDSIVKAEKARKEKEFIEFSKKQVEAYDLPFTDSLFVVITKNHKRENIYEFLSALNKDLTNMEFSLGGEQRLYREHIGKTSQGWDKYRKWSLNETKINTLKNDVANLSFYDYPNKEMLQNTLLSFSLSELMYLSYYSNYVYELSRNSFLNIQNITQLNEWKKTHKIDENRLSTIKNTFFSIALDEFEYLHSDVFIKKAETTTYTFKNIHSFLVEAKNHISNLNTDKEKVLVIRQINQLLEKIAKKDPKEIKSIDKEIKKQSDFQAKLALLSNT